MPNPSHQQHTLDDLSPRRTPAQALLGVQQWAEGAVADVSSSSTRAHQGAARDRQRAALPLDGQLLDSSVTNAQLGASDASSSQAPPLHLFLRAESSQALASLTAAAERGAQHSTLPPVAIVERGMEQIFLASALARRCELRIFLSRDSRTSSSESSDLTLSLTLYAPSRYPRVDKCRAALHALCSLASSEGAKVRSLTLPNEWWEALTRPELQPQLERLFAACTPTLRALLFDSAPSSCSTDQPSISLNSHVDLFLLLGQLDQLESLQLPQLTLQPGDVDLSYLAMTLSNLRDLRLGRGVVKSAENLSAVWQLARLERLEWSGWTDATLRQFLSPSSASSSGPLPPLQLQELILRDEPELGVASSGHLSQLKHLTTLRLIHTPGLWDKMGTQALTNLRAYNLKHVQIMFQRPPASADHSFLSVLLQLASDSLHLGGGLNPSLLRSLLDCDTSSARFTAFPNRAGATVLTLEGVPLGSGSWFRLHPLRAGIGQHPASVRRHMVRTMLEGHEWSKVEVLRLVDCAQHACILPYLRLMQRLRRLELIDSAMKHPLQQREELTRPHTGIVNPFCFSSQPASAASSTSTPIRSLDFLSLEWCPALVELHCDYAIQPNFLERDPPIAGMQAVNELRRRLSGRWPQLPPLEFTSDLSELSDL